MKKLIILLLFPTLSWAAEAPKDTSAPASAPAPSSTDQVLGSLDYPELQVVPRASERLQMGAQQEGDKGWLTFWPLQLSALATLATGHSLSGEYNEDAGDTARKEADFRTKVAIGVGAGWIALSTYYMFTRPYGKENDKIKNIKVKDKRSELLRERLAEEALERPARLANILIWSSTITNFAANVLLFDQSTSGNNMYPAISLVMTALPFLFGNDYVTNYDKHLEYKRKIYAPVAYLSPSFNHLTSKVEPGMVLEWTF
jgi:hypothetical protein